MINNLIILLFHYELYEFYEFFWESASQRNFSKIYFKILQNKEYLKSNSNIEILIHFEVHLQKPVFP